MAEKADCGSAKAERSGVTASNQDLLQLGMDSLLFLELSSDIQHYLVYASMRNGRGRICLLMDSRSLSVLSQRRRLPLRSRKYCGTTPTSVMRPSL